MAGLPGSEGVVAVYVDGVYHPYTGGNIFELADVSRIEVLKGPQGTLFGRNATGGAIQIFTQGPSFAPTEIEFASCSIMADQISHIRLNLDQGG